MVFELLFQVDEFLQVAVFGFAVRYDFVRVPFGIFGDQVWIGFVGFGSIKLAFAVVFDFQGINDVNGMGFWQLFGGVFVI